MISFGIPFIWKLQFLPELFPILKSFRSLGRFAWPFYFISAFTGVAFILRWKTTQPRIVNIILIALGILFCFEGLNNLEEKSKNIISAKIMNQSNDTSVSYETAQAILPLPFYNIGSDNFTTSGSELSVLNSMILSLQTGIPLLAHHGARQSVFEAKDLMGLMGRRNYPKSISQSLFTDQNIIILKSGELLNDQEIQLFESSSKYKNDSIIRSISINQLFTSLSESQPKLVVYENSFDSIKSPITIKGLGSLSIKKLGFQKIIDIPNYILKKGKYSLEFWAFTGGENYGERRLNNCMVIIEEYESGATQWLKHSAINDSYIFNNNWTLIRIPFEVKDQNTKKSILLSGQDYGNIEVIIDELTIRKL